MNHPLAYRTNVCPTFKQPTTTKTMKTITVKYRDAYDWRSKQQPVSITIVDQRDNQDVIRLTVDEARQLVARLTAALPVE